MLDTPCSEVVWRVLATHCIRQFPLHFPSRASPCAITFQLASAGFEPANLGTKGQHATPRPLKPLTDTYRIKLTPRTKQQKIAAKIMEPLQIEPVPDAELNPGYLRSYYSFRAHWTD